MAERALSQVSHRIIVILSFSISHFPYLLLYVGVLPDGKQLWLIPEGLTNETDIKCIIGNGVVIEP